jgi:predicted HTH transcriptional regulator
MRGYSPFDKPFTDISAEDLVALTEATEGWYIEYKREVPKADAIAKSIAAFANTYGGWLFYGVEEKSKAEPVAGSFPGIDRADVDPSMQRMRQAIATL